MATSNPAKNIRCTECDSPTKPTKLPPNGRRCTKCNSITTGIWYKDGEGRSPKNARLRGITAI